MVKETSCQMCDCSVIHGSAVEEAKQAMANCDLDRELSIHKALGDLTRLKIVHALEATELCVCDLSVVLNMTKSAVSHQLSFLKELGLVDSRRDGKNVFYSITSSVCLCCGRADRTNHCCRH